jgi:hypothetical protein
MGYSTLSSEAKALRLSLRIGMDEDTLLEVACFDASVKEFYASPGLPSRRRARTIREFAGQLAIYHNALPFHEAERDWIGDVFMIANYDLTHGVSLNPDPAHGVKLLGQMKSEVLMTGVHRDVEGQELLDRWLNWRDRTGEYEGQGTRGVAHLALQNIAQILDPEAAA